MDTPIFKSVVDEHAHLRDLRSKLADYPDYPGEFPFKHGVNRPGFSDFANSLIAELDEHAESVKYAERTRDFPCCDNNEHAHSPGTFTDDGRTIDVYLTGDRFLNARARNRQRNGDDAAEDRYRPGSN